MARFVVSWSTKAWHYQEIEAESHSAASEAWDADGPRTTYQEDLTDDWWEVECADDEENCPEDDRYDEGD